MRPNARALLAAILAVALALLAGCGGDDESPTASGKATGNPTDRAFTASMIPHHRSAVEMAAIARTEATSDFVKELAADIARSQNAEIALMQRIDGQLARAGVKKGTLPMADHEMGLDMEASGLRGAKPFDDKFIEMMIPHHEGAVAMAKVELRDGRNAELKELSRDIITTQEREISAMRAHTRGEAPAGAEHGDGGHG
jgi:uncharacterized protein (DUF305 family)